MKELKTLDKIISLINEHDINVMFYETIDEYVDRMEKEIDIMRKLYISLNKGDELRIPTVPIKFNDNLYWHHANCFIAIFKNGDMIIKFMLWENKELIFRKINDEVIMSFGKYSVVTKETAEELFNIYPSDIHLRCAIKECIRDWFIKDGFDDWRFYGYETRGMPGPLKTLGYRDDCPEEEPNYKKMWDKLGKRIDK